MLPTYYFCHYHKQFWGNYGDGPEHKRDVRYLEHANLDPSLTDSDKMLHLHINLDYELSDKVIGTQK